MRPTTPCLASICLALIALCSLAGPGLAADGIDSLNFKPATDQGDYLAVEQSQTLGRWGYAFGLMTEYSKGSLIAAGANGQKLRDIIDDQLAMHLGGAVGVLDWLNVGLLVEAVPYQQFNDIATGLPDNGARMGDMKLDLKARLLDSRRYPVGLAIVPFITFPTGSDAHYVGNGVVTGGALLAVETPRYADRVSASLNVGAQASESSTLSSGTKAGSRFLIGTALNVAVIKPVQVIAELTGWTPFSNFWEKNARDLEFNGAVRWMTPLKGLAVTAGAGTGILNAMGAPDYRAFLTLAYRRDSRKVAAPAAEIVIRTNRIHFAFDKWRIRPESFPVLDGVAKTILDEPAVKRVVVEGHTDGLGGPKYNQRLSQRRAQSVVEYLVKKGVPAGMLTAVGKGEGEPIADNRTRAGRAENRRIEFHLELEPGANVRVEEGADAPVFMER
jgi:outer membrane protein OmpA-like peptidoglycan-associated protein